MAHSFVLVILPEGLGSSADREKVEESIDRIMSPYFTESSSGEHNEQGLWDSYEIGGVFDGAVNGLPNYYQDALTLSRNNPDKDYGPLFRRLASEELKRNSCKVSKVRLPARDDTVFPAAVVLPNGSVKKMPEWFLFPDFVSTADGKLEETPLPLSSMADAKASRQAWGRAWVEIVENYGDRLAVGLDCHL
jgi:hypothetical protein